MQFLRPQLCLLTPCCWLDLSLHRCVCCQCAVPASAGPLAQQAPADQHMGCAQRASPGPRYLELPLPRWGQQERAPAQAPPPCCACCCWWWCAAPCRWPAHPRCAHAARTRQASAIPHSMPHTASGGSKGAPFLGASWQAQGPDAPQTYQDTRNQACMHRRLILTAASGSLWWARPAGQPGWMEAVQIVRSRLARPDLCDGSRRAPGLPGGRAPRPAGPACHAGHRAAPAARRAACAGPPWPPAAPAAAGPALPCPARAAAVTRLRADIAPALMCRLPCPSQHASKATRCGPRHLHSSSLRMPGAQRRPHCSPGACCSAWATCGPEVQGCCCRAAEWAEALHLSRGSPGSLCAALRCRCVLPRALQGSPRAGRSSVCRLHKRQRVAAWRSGPERGAALDAGQECLDLGKGLVMVVTGAPAATATHAGRPVQRLSGWKQPGDGRWPWCAAMLAAWFTGAEQATCPAAPAMGQPARGETAGASSACHIS